jgi:hypothetical protein
MKNRLKLIVSGCAFACGLMITTHTSFAQPASGEWEFTLGGGGSADQEFDHGGFSLVGSVGYFFTPNFEAAVRQQVGFSSGGSDVWMGSTGMAVDYHFLLGKFVPFIGANIGADYGTRVNGQWGLGPEAGLKYYVYEKTFLFVMGQYRWLFDRLEDVTGHASDGTFGFTIGIGFNVGGTPRR